MLLYSMPSLGIRPSLKGRSAHKADVGQTKDKPILPKVCSVISQSAKYRYITIEGHG
jgi:hypothetical protein